MERIGPIVKRPYDLRRRSRQAEATRTKVLDAATSVLLTEGYAATTVARVARDVHVSVETVYKAFGNRPGLVRAVVERALEGVGPVPAEARSDALQRDESDPRVVLSGWGQLSAEVSPRVAPVLLALRLGAAHDNELAQLRQELEAGRYRRMEQNARRLADAGHLRDDVDTAGATDVLWTYTSPELFELLVQRRGWTSQRYGRFIAQALVAHLLPPDSTRELGPPHSGPKAQASR